MLYLIIYQLKKHFKTNNSNYKIFNSLQKSQTFSKLPKSNCINDKFVIVTHRLINRTIDAFNFNLFTGKER